MYVFGPKIVDFFCVFWKTCLKNTPRWSPNLQYTKASGLLYLSKGPRKVQESLKIAPGGLKMIQDDPRSPPSAPTFGNPPGGVGDLWKNFQTILKGFPKRKSFQNNFQTIFKVFNVFKQFAKTPKSLPLWSQSGRLSGQSGRLLEFLQIV